MLIKSLSVAATLAALTVGCSPESVVSAPRVPVPVLLGPIERVGGRRSDEDTSAPFNVEVEDYFSLTTSHGTQTTRGLKEGAGKVSARVLSMTDARQDRDVHIRGMHAGAWVWLSPDMKSLQRDEWVNVEATVAKEKAR